MSWDRRLLYSYIVGISRGNVASTVLTAEKTIGVAHQARWLTLSSRILSLYVCVAYNKLSRVNQAKVDRLVNFICHIYFPVSELT